MNWIEFDRKLNMNGQRIFTSLEALRIMDSSEIGVRFFLHRYVKKGAIVRLKNGLYALADNVPSELEIANKLYQPSYISFEYALSFHKIIPETVYTVTCATTKPTREFTVSGIAYHYYTIKKDAFFGYEPIKRDNAVILMATPEKAFIDYLYFVSLKKKVISDRINIRPLDKHRIFSYAEKFKREALVKLLEIYYDRKRIH
ncbi:MAG: hypothetical protein KKB22_06270 [Candidatus Omnitrophica bacterium]|nr:hypothetical protein [Candidatus Omnitrophota bacterium]